LLSLFVFCNLQMVDARGKRSMFLISFNFNEELWGLFISSSFEHGSDNMVTFHMLVFIERRRSNGGDHSHLTNYDY